jgi:hypothetical protein
MSLAAPTRAAETDRLRAPDALRPASFAERGIAAPFTTPALALARLRRSGPGGFEIVLPNLVDGRGVYLVPWSALPEIIAPTVHDRMLHEGLVLAGSFDPESVRLVHLGLLVRGFGGIDSTEAAARALGGDDRLATAVNLALMVQLIHAGGVTATEAAQAAESGRAGLEYKRAFDSIAASAGIDARALPDRIEALARSLAPLGLPEPQPAGRLRRAVRQLSGLRHALAAWANAQAGAEGEIAALCADAAARTLDRCERLLAMLDGRLVKLIPILRAWPHDREVLAEAKLRLAWLLDGWCGAIVTWETVRDAPRLHQFVALGAIFRALPLLPTEADPTDAGLDLARAHRRLMHRHCRRFDGLEGTPIAAAQARQMELANLYAETL